jgi:hypothetical protein
LPAVFFKVVDDVHYGFQIGVTQSGVDRDGNDFIFDLVSD